MRLLNVETLEFSNFFDAAIPEYLVLSHRWEGSETTLQEFETEKHSHSHFPKSSGTPKILSFCDEARKDGCGWVWVDTCCIDKTSSAELTEAINSMWRWYAQAKACYVYMSDVEPAKSSQSATPLRERLKKTAWFTRGWTLQEMLAPAKEMFFDSEWNLLGDRDEEPLSGLLHDFTGVKKHFFGNLAKIKTATVAERMLWVSKRETSRLEDIAYCMLGIFDVYMPLIYGEGLNAFQRLQQEIIKVSDDETIFVWTTEGRKRSGLLAEHPRDFGVLAGKEIVKDTWIERSPFAMTNKGLELEIYDSPLIKNSPKATVPFNCRVKGEGLIFVTLENCAAGSWCRTDLTNLGYATRLLHQPPPLDHEPAFSFGFNQRTPPHFKNPNGPNRFKIYVRQYNLESF